MADIRPLLDRESGAAVRRREWLCRAALLPGVAGLVRAAQNGATAGPSLPLKIQTIDGQVLEVHKQPGKVVLIDFMTTSCPTCKQASAGIQKLYEDFGARGFLAVALAIDADAARVLPMYRSLYGLTFPVGVLARAEAVRYLEHPPDKLLYVPVLVLLDKRGRVIKKKVGWTGDQEWRSAIAEQLARKG